MHFHLTVLAKTFPGVFFLCLSQAPLSVKSDQDEMIDSCEVLCRSFFFFLRMRRIRFSFFVRPAVSWYTNTSLLSFACELGGLICKFERVRKPICNIMQRSFTSAFVMLFLAMNSTTIFFAYADGVTCACSQDSFVLQEFYHATGGSQWYDPWDLSSSGLASFPCTASGIMCDSAAGRVTSITLANRGLVGTLPNNLSTLSALLIFNVSMNQLYGTLPSFMSSWNQITTFDVSNNSISGTLPPNYGQWATIKTFIVLSNNLTGSLPSAYSLWSASLTMFDVSRNQLNGTLPIAYKHWWNNGASTPPYENVFTVSNNNFSGTLPPEYSQWRGLKLFEVQNNVLTGTLPQEYADWTSTAALSPEGKSLYEFHVEYNSLSGTLPLEYRSWGGGISRVYLNNNNFSGTLPPEYSSWVSLTVFFVNDCPLLSSVLPESYSMWSRLEILYVQSCDLFGTFPVAYSKWKRLTWFNAANNRFSGSIPASYSQMQLLQRFTVQNNSLSGAFPASFALLSSLLQFNVGSNNLSGTIPTAWGENMISLSIIMLLGNRLTGTIPASIFKPPLLVTASFGFNDLSGDISKIVFGAALSFVDFQNNSRLHGNIPSTAGKQLLLMTTCGTRLLCPKPSNALQYCFTPQVLAQFSTTATVSIVLAMFMYTSTCPSFAVDDGTKTSTILLPEDSEIAPPLDAFSTYTPKYNPPPAFVLVANLADPVSGVALSVLGNGRCAPAASKNSTSITRILLSPFFALGPGVSVLGNIALTVVLFALHLVAVVFLKSRRDVSTPKDSKSRKIERAHRHLGSCMLLLVSSAAKTLKFPSLSVTLTLQLAKGIAFYCGQGFIEGAEDEMIDSVEMRIVSIIVAILFVVGVVLSWVVAERRGVSSALQFETYKLAALRRWKWVPPFVLPSGRWGPDDARQRLAALRGPVKGGSEKFSMLTAGLGISGALLVGAVPGSVNGCIAQAVGQCVLLGGAVVLVLAQQPMRIQFAGWLLCAQWSTQALLNISMAASRANDSNNCNTAVDATAVLTVIHAVIGMIAGLHRGFVILWERGVHPNDMMSTNNSSSPTTLNIAAHIQEPPPPPHLKTAQIANGMKSRNQCHHLTIKVMNEDSFATPIDVALMSNSEQEDSNITTIATSMTPSSFVVYPPRDERFDQNLRNLVELCCLKSFNERHHQQATRNL
ncbi:GP46-like surface antigen, putative [Bodo saltans]|uniref:GP46-like surface antigen, putative n=1 Tax=Bodo saltans TaxID=75058 RepID=A0A0S4JEP5_BODSA|nr:GP46-like surface antigen, putative [Bodo saltans]|eukprot:CUG88594.1 GP46-like surface antigen, putative [Bodo saltans]